MDAPGEEGPVGGIAVVIFAGGNVAGTPRKVDVGHIAVFGCALVAGQTDEFGSYDAGAVNSGGMDGVVVKAGDLRGLVPKGDGLQYFSLATKSRRFN